MLDFMPLGSHRCPIEVLVVFRSDPTWHTSGVYLREDDQVSMHPRWPLAWTDSNEDRLAIFKYLASRVLSGQGGNYYSYEVEGFETADVGYVEPLVAARDVQVRTSTYGPLGESAGSIGNPWAVAVPGYD